MGLKLFKRSIGNSSSVQYSLFPDLKLPRVKNTNKVINVAEEKIDPYNPNQIQIDFEAKDLEVPPHLLNNDIPIPTVKKPSMLTILFFYFFPLSKGRAYNESTYDSEIAPSASDSHFEKDQSTSSFYPDTNFELEIAYNFHFKFSNFALGITENVFRIVDFLINFATKFNKNLHNFNLAKYRVPLRVVSIPLVILLGSSYSVNFIQPKEPTNAPLEYLSNPYSNYQAATFFEKEFSALDKALGSSQGNTLSLANFSTPKSPIKVSAWLPWWSWSSGLDSSLANQSSLGDISAFLFTLKNDGSIVYKSDIQNLSNAINRVHAAGYKIEAAISEEPNASEILTMFQTKDSRTKLIDNIINATILFDGVDIDFEALQFSSSESDKAKIRILYPVFLIELRERLHSSGKTLSVSVGARTSVTDPNWNVFDYQSLGLVADKIKIMAYDLHNSKSNPGPVSSKVWINNILNYALSVVSPEKITVGLPSYAYLYSSDDKVKVITGNSFESFLLKHPGSSVRDTDSELMHHTFSSSGVNYDFYYPDAQFFKSVSSLLKERNITSVAIWSVGNEAKDVWDSLK
jgi:hypothetical protein